MNPKWAEVEPMTFTRSRDLEDFRDVFTADRFPDVIEINEVVLDQAEEYGRCTGEYPICHDSTWVKFNFDNGLVYYRILDYSNYRGTYLLEAVDVEPE